MSEMLRIRRPVPRTPIASTARSPVKYLSQRPTQAIAAFVIAAVTVAYLFSVFLRRPRHEALEMWGPYLRRSQHDHVASCQPRPRVCSDELRSAEIALPSGSLDAMAALWRHDVTCFSVGVTHLADGTYVARSQHIVQATLETGGADIGTARYADLASIAQDAVPVTESFPRLEDVVQRFADLLTASGLLQIKPERPFFGHAEPAVMDVEAPMLFLALDHDQATVANAERVARLAHSHDIGRHIGLVLSYPRRREEHVNAVAAIDQDIHLGYLVSAGMMSLDVVEHAAELAYDFLVPSIKLPKSVLHACTDGRLPAVAWDLEPGDVRAVRRAAEAGVDLALSVTPIRMRDMLIMMDPRCGNSKEFQEEEDDGEEEEDDEEDDEEEDDDDDDDEEEDDDEDDEDEGGGGHGGNEVKMEDAEQEEEQQQGGGGANRGGGNRRSARVASSGETLRQRQDASPP